MNDHPEYDIAEFVLAGLFIAAAASALVWVLAGAMASNTLQVAEGAGLVLMLLGGAVHPKKFVVDCLTFPLSFVASTGRESSLTVIAAWLGMLLWLGCLAYSWFNGA